jgi:hypothetical protein
MIAAGWHRRTARVAGRNDMAASMRHWQRVRTVEALLARIGEEQR